MMIHPGMKQRASSTADWGTLWSLLRQSLGLTFGYEYSPDKDRQWFFLEGWKWRGSKQAEVCLCVSQAWLLIRHVNASHLTRPTLWFYSRDFLWYHIVPDFFQPHLFGFNLRTASIYLAGILVIYICIREKYSSWLLLSVFLEPISCSPPGGSLASLRVRMAQ